MQIIATNKIRKSSYKSTRTTQAPRDSTSKRCETILCRYGGKYKKGTAASLEGFVAMKTKPIHNSVKQWADRVILEVKSKMGWIRTGGNYRNNKKSF